jgi:hypothetical protein
MLIGKAWHGVESAAADDADFCLSQNLLLTRNALIVALRADCAANISV